MGKPDLGDKFYRIVNFRLTLFFPAVQPNHRYPPHGVWLFVLSVGDATPLE